MRGYSDTTPMEYAEFALCREMGWTFNQLDEQPAWRVEQAFLFLEREHIFNESQKEE
ncbi:hypothetical protein ACS2BX_25940 [Bacillus cereus group sp. BceL300]|uniref:hypothetical protein n=1 Tax=Bacillus cereus group TaxID=86661 RepID=UPI0014447AEE|nr:hypothetical protein [Bacillus cereus]MDK7481003.1 hypothetical protein [Bacillus cereus]NKW77425.1 hypothetical protein [Bacillus cereus]NKX14843.1 hypothetical protein [Bacillus cereus]HDR8003431.1 hypothetical protein [Bacillus cereus]HDR8014978.1 hypothetical protein [Bacillus cereus]